MVAGGTRRPVQAGEWLVGRYRLLELIGAGDMGVVWLAGDELLGRTVAVKRIGSGYSAAPELARAWRAVLREARIGAMVDHPRLLRVLDVVTDTGEPWLVLEHVVARGWASWLAQYGLMTPPSAARIAAQVAEALAALHRAGIVHGDVTADNILITEGGQVRLADLGLARLVDDQALTPARPDLGAVMTGARSHRAPEVLAGGIPGTPADVYALGAIVFEATLGAPADCAGAADDPTRWFPVPARAASLAGLLGALLDPVPGRRPSAGGAWSSFAAVAAGPTI